MLGIQKRALVHLVNPFWDPHGGSELRAIELGKSLASECEVKYWSHVRPDPRLLDLADIRHIETRRLSYPRGGTLVLVGAYFKLGFWLKLAQPYRTVLIYNTPDPDQLSASLRALTSARHRRIEIVFASEALKSETGLEGTVEPSLIDISRFTPLPSLARPFTIGRLSRDVAVKHHKNDAAFYLNYVKTGGKVRIMGPSASLAAELVGVSGIDLLETGEVPSEQFYRSIDCLFYRTSEDWFESWGRVVIEAMAAGLPVVCGRRGGYNSIIQHGENGFLFDNEVEAMGILDRLRRDGELRVRVGLSARSTVESLLLQARKDIVNFYTSPHEGRKRLTPFRTLSF